jgi:hypothetical protein
MFNACSTYYSNIKMRTYLRRRMKSRKKNPRVILLSDQIQAEVSDSDTLNGLKCILDCPVCLDMTSNPHVVQPCEHVFCGDCIALWEVIYCT